MEVVPFLKTLEVMVSSVQNRAAPTQHSVEVPLKKFIADQCMTATDEACETGAYRLRMMYTNLVNHHKNRRPIPKDFASRFTRCWRILDTVFQDEPDEPPEGQEIDEGEGEHGEDDHVSVSSGSDLGVPADLFSSDHPVLSKRLEDLIKKRIRNRI